MQITEGLILQIRILSDVGLIMTHGRVTTIGHNHLKVSCERKFDAADFLPDQNVEIRPMDNLRVVPLSTRFIRIGRENPSEMVLRLPNDDWQQNRRSFVRVPARLRVRLRTPDTSSEIGHTIDISGSGILLNTHLHLSSGDAIELTVDMPDPDDPPIEARGIIRRIAYRGEEATQYGIEFLEISSRDQDRLCRLVLNMEFERRRQGYHL